MSHRLRIGVDVGGTFTKAVAVASPPLVVHARASVPTTHRARAGVAEGVAAALRELIAQLGEDRSRVELVAFSTTQAMNALLEGDVGTVGVVGIGYRPHLRVARKRTHVGDIPLAPGRKLATRHAFVDASSDVSHATVEETLEELVGRGATALAVSGAFAVDTPGDEERFVRAARQRGIPACAGHELTGAYGLETRTLTAAINASILPIVERTAAMVEEALAEAQLEVPLLVLRGDGGSMSSERFRDQPSLTIGSAPAAGVAAVLHELRLADGIVVECGGTSTNVSVVRGGRAQLRSLRVMRQPTFIRSVDSWVVGARRREHAAPRTPRHIRGRASERPYRGAPVRLVRNTRRAGGRKARARGAARRRPGGVRVRGRGRRKICPHGDLCRDGTRPRLAGDVPGELPGGGSCGVRAARRAAARHGRGRGAGAARGGCAKDSRRRLGGREALQAARGCPAGRAGRRGRRARSRGRPDARSTRSLPDHAEVLSAVGAAVSLVRAEVVRTVGAGDDLIELAHQAERECIDAGAAPSTVTVETKVDNAAHVIRATATGSVALQTGAAEHHDASDEERDLAAANALEVGREHSGWSWRTSTTACTRATAPEASPSSIALARSPSPRKAGS